MFEQYGIPADGWAADYTGPRPSSERSGTPTTTLGPKQLAWLEEKSARFKEARAAADRSLAHSAEAAEKLEPVHSTEAAEKLEPAHA